MLCNNDNAMEGLIFSEDICRLCLWRSSKLFPIFSLEGELQGIPLKIEMCLPVSVTREDVLPKLICSQCIYKLEMFSEFRNSCVRSEQLLKRYTSHEPVQIPASHTVVLQMPEELKVEVQDPDPIAVEQEIPFFCVIPTDMHKEGTEECGPRKVQDENVNRVNREAAGVENSNAVATAIKKKVKRNRKVVKRKRAVKKPSKKSDLLAARRDHTKHGRSRYLGSSHVADVPALTASRQAVHICKHCSKNFPSRAQLSRHLTSSNCLFQYTCRYCAKVFCNAKNRIHHERNHRGKKNFICRICKQKFQSSFDLNVHTLQGCEYSAFYGQQHSTVITETKLQKKQERDTEGLNEKRQSEGFLNKIWNNKTELFNCKYCKKDFTNLLPYKKHIRTCRHVMAMSKVNEMQKAHIKPANKSVSLRLKQDNSSGNRKTKNKIPNGLSDNIDIIESSRGKEVLLENQRATPLDNPLEKGLSDISLKASLLAVLGLKEKPKPTDLKTTEKPDEMKISKTSTDNITDEVVTVCDICRKIFTSESGMLNHQATVHNRNLTSERINSLMRVEI